jgi:hypothetical protein
MVTGFNRASDEFGFSLTWPILDGNNAPSLESIDSFRAGRSPASGAYVQTFGAVSDDFGSSLGRIGVLTEQEDFGEIVAQVCPSLTIGTGTAPGAPAATAAASDRCRRAHATPDLAAQDWIEKALTRVIALSPRTVGKTVGNRGNDLKSFPISPGFLERSFGN